MNMSDDKRIVSSYDRMEGRYALPTPLAMRLSKRWTDGRRAKKARETKS